MPRSTAFLIGMSAAGLADLWGVRALMLASALLTLAPGLLAAVLPSLGQSAAEWRRTSQLLRTGSASPRYLRAASQLKKP